MIKSGRAVWLSAALAAAGLAGLGAWLDARYGWIEPAFDFAAHQFYEMPLLERLRRPSQLDLVRVHLAIGSGLLVLALYAGAFLGRAGRAFLGILLLGYAIRAGLWIAGGNLPLVPGDSCHYLEVATSVLRGEGPVKHYVESYFRDYPAIREGNGVLDDWATPLFAYVLAGAFRLAGLDGSSALESRIVVAKAVSFMLNWLCLPVLGLIAWRRQGARVALAAAAALAVLPAHAIYAGMILRESLTTLAAILAVGALIESISVRAMVAMLGWGMLAGVAAGFAALARTTAIPLFAAAWLCLLLRGGKRAAVPLLASAVAATLVALPWAWETWREYGSPFYSYTGYFEYNFSWTIHHYQQGNTRPDQFYTRANLPEIVRIKLKSLGIIAVYSTMILGLPLAAGFVNGLRNRASRSRDLDLAVASIAVVFVLATLKSIADVTQVEQLARYYLPVYTLMLPTAAAGVLAWLDGRNACRSIRVAAAATWVALVWSAPSWAYDFTWLSKPFQLHWPAIRETGRFIEDHPELVPKDARIITWFPWELRVASDRTTILMPRNYDPARIREVARQYGATHLLWGSFEPPPYFAINPERWHAELERLRIDLGLKSGSQIYQSRHDPFFPVELYRLR